jgi:hypothetical protein
MALDFGSLFSGGGEAGFQIDPSLIPTPASKPSFFTDPNNINMLAMLTGKAGSAMSNPGSVGDVVGKTAVQMAQSSAINKAPSVAAPVPTAPTAPAPNPLDTAKGYSKLGSMLKDAFAIDPKLVPESYKDNFASALSMNPSEGMVNPTVPVAANPAPAAAGAQPLVQTLPAALAMTMTPEQVQANQQLDLAKSAESRALALNPVDIAERQARTAHYGDLHAYQQWQMDPQRVEDAIRQNTAPVLAQLGVLKGKDQLTKDNVSSFLKANPGIASMATPGGGTVGQWAEMNAADPEAAKNIGSIIEKGISYNAAKYTADAHLKAVQATAAATGNIKQFTIDSQMYEKANADIAKWEAAPTIEAWNKMTAGDKMMAAGKGITGPRTPALQDAINKSKIMRDSLGAKLYGPSYSKLREMEEKAGGGADIVVTLEQLKGMTEGQRATSTSYLPEFMKMFSDQNILSGLAGAVSNPVPAEEHPITKYLRGGGEL